MLNWDDYGKEDNTTPQSSPQIDNEVVKKTAEAVAEEKSVTQQAVKEETPQANTNIGEGSRSFANVRIGLWCFFFYSLLSH